MIFSGRKIRIESRSALRSSRNKMCMSDCRMRCPRGKLRRSNRETERQRDRETERQRDVRQVVDTTFTSTMAAVENYTHHE